MTETPEQRVARLEAELAAAKVDAVSKELDAARTQAGLPRTPGLPETSGTGGHSDRAEQLRRQFLELREAGPLRGPVHLAKAPESSQDGGSPAWSPTDGSWAKEVPQTAADDVGLPPAPRSVPWQYKVMFLPWSWWTAFALFMVAVAPIALWILAPVTGAIAGGLTFLVVLVLRLRRDRLQLSLLKWGEVARVIDVDTVSIGTYYSGTTYQNVRLPQAHGWHVTRDWYSGPGTKTNVTYEVNGQHRTITLRGLPYDNGVILADPRHPARALCVSAWAYDLDRDPAGNWTGEVHSGAVLGSVAMILLLVAWTAGMITLFCVEALSLHGFTRT